MKQVLVFTLTLVYLFSVTSNAFAESVSTNEKQELIDLWGQSVKANAKTLKSIAFNSNDNYEDLQFLKTTLKDKRMVMLGESSHGSSEFNQAKVRLAQFLHNEMDFKVIAFESGLGETSGSYHQIEKLSTEEMLKKSIYGVWHTKELIPLFQSMKDQVKTDKPFVLSGFDMQPGYGYGNFLQDWLGPIDTVMATEASTLEEKLAQLYTLDDWNEGNWDQDYTYLNTGYNKVKQFLKDHELKLQQQFPENKDMLKIIKRVIDDRIYLIRNVLKQQILYNSSIALGKYDLSTSLRENVVYLRDEMMANTLTWIAEDLYPNQKIIVWGHNYHVRKNNSIMELSFDIHPYKYGAVPNMAELLPSRLKKQSYTIGEFMYRGESAGNDGSSMPVKEIKDPSSLEAILNQASSPYSFLDLSQQTIKEEANSWMFTSRKGLYWGVIEETFVPIEQYDGIIFVDHSTPSQYIKFQ
ncbi:erythromycin esterase family protein [Paenibacillus sp. SYP-B3998]|uniref:Erythromycin esterase family protein n=2 Tax=Paenibacillus sp. SYP-B3998 TaxID=2678564 RepID=A0A6G3ZZE6_9BACL|nr:erythromycin esterase family protein [Paenibacillus sp. SYP-B3998]